MYFVCLKEKLPLHNSRKAVYNNFLYISRLYELHLAQTFSIPAKCRAHCIAFGTCGKSIGEKKSFIPFPTWIFPIWTLKFSSAKYIWKLIAWICQVLLRTVYYVHPPHNRFACSSFLIPSSFYSLLLALCKSFTPGTRFSVDISLERGPVAVFRSPFLTFPTYWPDV